MQLFNKIKWVVGILLLFLVIIATNLIDRKNFREIGNTVVTIFEDRLVAKDIIAGMTLLTKEKELAIASNNASFYSARNAKVNEKMESLIASFGETKLTAKEERVFTQLKGHLQELYSLEAKVIDETIDNALAPKISQINTDLQALSKIQIEEGRRQLGISKKASENIELYTQMEFYLLIFLAVIIQIAIIYRPGKEEDEERIVRDA